MEEIALLWGFDALLGLALAWLAWLALSSEDLFRAIVLFMIFGLVMALAWVRLEAPDIALAEAAIGAGITGALLLGALARLRPGAAPPDTAAAAGGPPGGARAAHDETAGPGRVARAVVALLLAAVGAGIGWAVLSLPARAPGLSEAVAARMAASGVDNPVTAVLINFRGYDTLLELAVLLLALLVVWSLGPAPRAREDEPGEVLIYLAALLVPVLVLLSGYLLWVGAFAPGGAFQAGSVLAAAALLLVLSGRRIHSGLSGLALRVAMVAGLATFVLAGVAMTLGAGRFLEYPLAHAGTLILVIEAASTLSIGAILAGLFLGGRLAERITASRPGADR